MVIECTPPFPSLVQISHLQCPSFSLSLSLPSPLSLSLSSPSPASLSSFLSHSFPLSLCLSSLSSCLSLSPSLSLISPSLLFLSLCPSLPCSFPFSPSLFLFPLSPSLLSHWVEGLSGPLAFPPTPCDLGEYPLRLLTGTATQETPL